MDLKNTPSSRLADSERSREAAPGSEQLPTLKAGDRVFWNDRDTDRSNRSQLGAVLHLSADSSVRIKTDGGEVLDVSPRHLVPLGDREGRLASGGNLLAPYGPLLAKPRELSDLIFYYGIQAKRDPAEAIAEVYQDNQRLNHDHLKGFLLRQVFAGDEALFMAGQTPEADEAALFSLIRAHGDTNLKLSAAEDIAKGWLGDRRVWHEGHLAFNVKVQQVLTPDELRGDATAVGLDVDQVWEHFQSWIWSSWTEELRDQAHWQGKKLPADVAPEGRSGGWAVPYLGTLATTQLGERNTLSHQGLKDFLKDLEEAASDPEDATPHSDLLPDANNLLTLRQIQCVIEETMSQVDTRWQRFLADEIQVRRKAPDHHTRLRSAARREADRVPPYTTDPMAVDYKEDPFDSSLSELRVIDASQASTSHPQGPLVLASFNLADRPEGHANAHLFARGAAMVERLKQDEALLTQAKAHLPAAVAQEVEQGLQDLRTLIEDVHPGWQPSRPA